MTEFLELTPPDDALDLFLGAFASPLSPEEIDTSQAAGRVNYEAIQSQSELPPFTRSTVDGYAVRARDTFGASDGSPAYLKLEGEVKMGDQAGFSLIAGQCALIHTGGMLPEAADAVVMVENTQSVNEREIEVLRSVGVGENIIKAGEDVRAGEEIIPPGTRLGPAEIGGLMALGITKVKVARLPLVGIVSSGDEIIPPEEMLKPGTIRDVNSYSLSALIEGFGAAPKRYGIVKDVREELSNAVQKALEECDFVIVTAGSSASVRDLTAEVIDELGKPGVIVHGVSVRPGKPTILAACASGISPVIKPVIGLPGNPVSALVIAMLFVEPVIDRLIGLRKHRLRPKVRARLSVNIASQAGREDWILAKLSENDGEINADPVFSKSNLIFSMSRADGLFRIQPQITGINAGEFVDVLLLE